MSDREHDTDAQFVSLKLDRDLLRLVEAKAKLNDRSRSAEIRVALRNHVEEDAA